MEVFFMKKLVILVGLLLALALFLGCTETSFCGDGICSSGEEATCPTDCAEPVEAKVNIYVSGAYDAEGDLSLFWHHNKDVYASAYQNITSRLGDNWYGQESKNLYISFNESQSGEQPIGSKRQISLTFSGQGDYYFEARSDDYAYRAVSEKITITDSGEYYVYLDLVPSNPAVRVKAYDEYGNILSGEGKITLTAVETYCSYGECNENEWEYDSRTIYDDEMNALFFVYMPYNYYNNTETRDIYYKIEVEKSGYLTQTQYYWPHSKYQERHVYMQKDVPVETGNMKVTIVPGIGTTQEDLDELEGQKVRACGSYKECQYTTISDGRFYFENLPYDTYYVYGGYGQYDSQSSHPPMSLAESKITVNSEVVYAEAKALRGYGMKLSILDGNYNLIDLETNEIYHVQYCNYYGDSNYCYGEETPYRLIMPNPLEQSGTFYSEEAITNLESQWNEIELEFNGEKKWFPLNYKQGYNEIVWQFEGLSEYNEYSILENTSRAAWKSAEPFGITDWANQGDVFAVRLKNNTNISLNPTKVSIGGSSYGFDINGLSPGSTLIAEAKIAGLCDGQAYDIISKDDVQITYDTEAILGKVQYGQADIVLKCN
jgi:hypothetical protein